MKLFGSYTSPFVRHCRIALIQEGCSFEFIETDYSSSAETSPTAKVPFFSDDEVQLSDSSSILKYIREKAGKTFLKELQDFENYAFVNTLMDSEINIYLMEKSGVSSLTNDYLKRQKNRVGKGLQILDQRFKSFGALESDSEIRCACFLDWGIYRKRFTLDAFENLQKFLVLSSQNRAFAQTTPPA